MRKRMTIVVTEPYTLDWFNQYAGVTVESVEDIPDPVKQWFVVEVESAPNYGPLAESSLQIALERQFVDRARTFNVTETEPHS